MMFLRKLCLILWKNLVIRKRHWILTLIEIVIPVLLFIVVALVRSEIGPSIDTLHPAKYHEILTEGAVIEGSMEAISESSSLLYAPHNNFTQKIMAAVSSPLKKLIPVGFESEDELVSYYESMNDTYHATYAVIFEGLLANEVPEHLKYKIRLSNPLVQTSRLFPEFQTDGPGYSGQSYLMSNFLTFQLLLDKEFISMTTGSNSSSYNLTLQLFPHPAYHEDNFTSVFSAMLPLFTVISFVMLCPAILKRVVEEKETGVKELMKMMGLKSWMLWCGWMLNAMLVSIVSVTIIVLLMKAPFREVSVLQYSNCFLVWILLLFYCAAGITFCFAISSFFSRPTLAMSVGVILWFLSYSVTFPFVMNGGSSGPSLKLLSAVLPNTAISWGYRLIVALESKRVGLTWMNFFEPPSGIKGDISVGVVWLMFVVDIVIYSIVTWYISSIMPGNYGLAKPWYFIFMPSYWGSSRVNNLTVSSCDDDIVCSNKFEKPPVNLSVGINIKNLRKVFKSFGGLNKTVAVDGVTLNIYSGEITALLGHNGAGKTTTMSILTGMYSPTSGSVHINGYDICESLDEVRGSLGLCPQHNLLFTDLTVLEHLLFFAMLKGCSNREANIEARDLLRKLNLENKKNKMCSTLSGGMKRKLSLGIALIGHTKVLMLDEPTSGMDPEARREIWDLLLNMRGERTILITTHFMEEADVLGDRIAIMDHGRVQCYGTTLFLKKLYGTGYQLNLLKQEGCDVTRITNTIQPIISDAKVKSEMGSVLCYMLPSEQSNKFPDLFDVLEREKQQLCISSIGVSITTLEEVFLRVGKEAEDEADGQANSESNLEYIKLNGSCEALALKKAVGANLLTQKVVALFTKRVLFTYRKWLTVLLQAVIAVVMALLTVTLSANTGGTTEPARVMSLNDYGVTDVLYSVNHGSPALSDKYEEFIKLTGSSVTEVEDVCTSLLSAGESDIQKYHTKFIIAAEFNSSSGVEVLNAMFSSNAIHSAPISLNVLTNFVLKNISQEKSITAVNHPLQNRESVLGEGIMRSVGVMMLWMTLMPFGLLFMIGSFMAFPQTERVSKAKQLQLMTGTSPLAYWFTCFMWDLLLYMIVALIMTFVVVFADPLNVFNGSAEIGTYFFMLVMYGVSAIPFAYLFSHFRNTTAGAFSLLVILSMLVGLIMSLVVYFMLLSEDYKSTGKVLKYCFEFVPHFAITYAFTRFSYLVLSNNQCKLKKSYCNSISGTIDLCCLPGCKDGYCPAIYKPYLAFADDGNQYAVGEEILYMAIDSVLYFFLIIMIEYGVFGMLYEELRKKLFGNRVESQVLDDDVVHEQDRVDGQIQVATVHRDNDIMLVRNLIKKYARNLTAVKGISFGVAPGECFGLLGVNGAGKTTTFKMLTGDEIPTEGEAWIRQYSLSKDKSKFLEQIGYCPQFDAINEALTGREMLKLFASLRGISKINVDSEVSKWVKLMGLQEYENRQCGTYSGGNKRKLSTAMALIGNPPIVFLDEPTSGVDPVARRNLWTVLTSIQKSGQSVVLTSHSMEECEALCNRLAIMVGGQFVCMGGIQYLKQKFGQGFTVMVKLRAAEANEHIVYRLKCKIEENFNSGCVLKDEHPGLLHYHVTDPNIPWKYLFTKMEKVKHDYDVVEDYTISETTLEQVFLSFARLLAE